MSLRLLSLLPVASNSPVGLNPTQYTLPRCCLGLVSSISGARSVLSSLEIIICLQKKIAEIMLNYHKWHLHSLAYLRQLFCYILLVILVNLSFSWTKYRVKQPTPVCPTSIVLGQDIYKRAAACCWCPLQNTDPTGEMQQLELPLNTLIFISVPCFVISNWRYYLSTRWLMEVKAYFWFWSWI